ncbi:MAG: hypothetical protein HN353_05645 [Bdellovibrionales bacterium]|jgi:hypothetical protein|nr:hypothetical protein [Bdellovibrionales bacterium]MBT3525074.1 hypothetical protein [Bdellovibrionales bacterium]MBT7669786.1 hypothetical protein [Bdellovibrionales bacterium]MBT7767405.1 hypothetical protein [Bdellovibrionales bacterium]
MSSQIIRVQFGILLLLVALFIPYLLNRPIIHHGVFLLLGQRGEATVSSVNRAGAIGVRPKKYVVSATKMGRSGEQEWVVLELLLDRGAPPKEGEVIPIYQIELPFDQLASTEDLTYYYPTLKWSILSILGSIAIWGLLAYLYLTRERGQKFKDYYR